MSRKRTYPCGHSGKGRFCLRCEQQTRDSEQSTTDSSDAAAASSSPSKDLVNPETIDKETWREAFAADPIPLKHLPNRNLVQRARQILQEIERGAPWHQFNGKRLQHDRTIVSVPLGRRYRILFRTDDGAPRPVEVLSHEAYNATKPGRR